MKRTQNIFELEGNYLNGHGTNCAGKASVLNRVGEKHIAKNGCEYTIVKANNHNDILVEFEDGVRVKTKSAGIGQGEIAHPTLKTHGSGTFAGFTTQSAFHEDGDAYYVCRCQSCGFRDVLTPKQMLEHYKTSHNNQ